VVFLRDADRIRATAKIAETKRAAVVWPSVVKHRRWRRPTGAITMTTTISKEGTKSANKRVDPLRSQTRLPRDEIISSFLAHFEGRYATQRRGYAEEELAAAQHLVETKFSSEAWTKRIP